MLKMQTDVNCKHIILDVILTSPTLNLVYVFFSRQSIHAVLNLNFPSFVAKLMGNCTSKLSRFELPTAGPSVAHSPSAKRV